MANYAVKYVKSVDEYLTENHSEEENSIKLEDHLIQISFFQHERLIHLIVTVCFAMLDMIMIAVSFFACALFPSLLVILFTLLLIPYIFHYYFLENSVQKMYKQYDKLKEIVIKN